MWVAFLLSFEIFFSRRFWCRYACPMGLTYGVLGTAAPPVQIQYELDKCVHEANAVKCASCRMFWRSPRWAMLRILLNISRRTVPGAGSVSMPVRKAR